MLSWSTCSSPSLSRPYPFRLAAGVLPYITPSLPARSRRRLRHSCARASSLESSISRWPQGFRRYLPRVSRRPSSYLVDPSSRSLTPAESQTLGRTPTETPPRWGKIPHARCHIPTCSGLAFSVPAETRHSSPFSLYPIRPPPPVDRRLKCHTRSTPKTTSAA